MNRKGLSLTELMVSAVLLGIVMFAATGYAINFFDVSYIHSKQMQNINETRNISTGIANELSNASYIYPASVNIDLSTSENGSFTINTNNSVAMLFKEGSLYGLTAYYVQNGDLYQFISEPSDEWPNNTSPATDLISFSGSASKVLSDIDTANSSLTYILNYSNGVTDESLKGEISGITTNDTNALIEGIDWQIAQDNIEDQTIRIREFSRNVPRFIE